MHTTEVVNEWFKNHPEIEVLRNWPAKSPDLNPFESLWAETTRDCHYVFPKTRQNLERTIVKNWEKLRGNSRFFKNLCSSMEMRLWEVIANRGGPTGF